MYGLNPSVDCSVFLLLMNPKGDAFFDLRALSTYYSCHLNKSAHGAYPGQCDNPEEISNNLVVTKVEVLGELEAAFSPQT